jgi:hypothetical protein
MAGRHGGPGPTGAPRTLKSRFVVAAGVIALVAWLAAIVIAQVGGGSEQPAVAPEAPVEAREIARGDIPPYGPGKVCVTAEYDWDIYDGGFLAFHSDNVFSGRVVEKTETATAWTSIPGDDETPYTRYAVLVEEVAKDSGPAPVVRGERVEVELLGGPGKKTGAEHVAAPISCGQQIVGGQLEVGADYLFSTVHEPDRGGQQIIAPPAGHVPLETAQERDATVQAYRKLIRRQVDPSSPDVGPCTNEEGWPS